MSRILSIETATEICSVCLSESEKIVSLAESKDSNSHSSVLTILIQKVFSEVGFSIDQIDAIALSEGPGSYTGLRIGASVAKGLCYSLDKPLLSVPTLKAMAFGASNDIRNENALYCPMIDARRMEVYMALYDFSLDEILSPQPKIIDPASNNLFPKNQEIIFFGSGSSKCISILDNPEYTFVDSFKNSASHLLQLAEDLFFNKRFADIAYYEPTYLKNFVLFKN